MELTQPSERNIQIVNRANAQIKILHSGDKRELHSWQLEL